MSLVAALQITKRFRDVTAVNNLSFTVHEGSLFGFLGPNGAGKTTTMRVVLDIIKPDQGQVTWRGRPFHQLGRGFYGYLAGGTGSLPEDAGCGTPGVFGAHSWFGSGQGPSGDQALD
jgi:ABC-type uncharacterized transport system ATPase subunit